MLRKHQLFCIILVSLIFASCTKANPMSPQKTYPSLKAAIQNEDFEKYKAKKIPNKKELILDTSEGGGYKCCEQPTFYVYVDNVNHIFWIETYQSSLSKINDNWYGPFALK